MTNKVLLIRPKNIYSYNNYPALNLISLGTQLEKAGFKARIVNCAFESDPLKTIENELKGALFAGISIVTSEVPDAYDLVKFIKAHSDVPVVAGGWHCTLFPEQMADSEYIDYVVAGEGEEHILDIAGLLKDGQKGGKKIHERKIVDLESLPLPDYGIDGSIERFISSYLTDRLSEYVRKPMRWLPYESSRGCPSQCTFCINTVTNNRQYRKKSADKVVEEIVYLVKKFKLTHLKIVDDNFFVDINRVRNICRGIVENKLNITWDGECRCDYFNERMLNDETLDLCKKSGLVQLTIGVESGSSHTLELMKKGITPEQAEHAVEQCNRYKIIARSAFIIEIPGEELHDIKKTISFINRLRKYPYFTCGVGTFRPYPKCELTVRLLEEGYLQEPKSFYEWTNREIIDMYTSAEYIRPWQVNGKYSESAAYYLNMESAVRLGNHQIDRSIDRLKNDFFRYFAKIRNRVKFYGLSFDKKLYKKFLVNFYKRRGDLEKSGSYPLSCVGED